MKVKSTIQIKKGTEQSAGFDISAVEDLNILPGTIGKVKTNLRLEIPVNYFGKIETRSSYALKGIFAEGGVIDSDYRGEICVLLYNSTSENYFVKKNDKVAQIIFFKIPEIKIILSDEFSETKRGFGGFGSTN